MRCRMAVLCLLFSLVGWATSAQSIFEVEVGFTSDYVARTGFHTNNPSFQGCLSYIVPCNRRGDAWWVGLTGYAGGGIYSEEYDIFAGVTCTTGRSSWLQFIVSYDELEPIIQLGVDDGDLIEIVPSHHWLLGRSWQARAGVDWLQPITWFHGVAVPFADINCHWSAGRLGQLTCNAKIGYDGGGYGADVGFISNFTAELNWPLDRRGLLILRPWIGLFVPLSGSINDRNTYLYGGLSLGQSW